MLNAIVNPLTGDVIEVRLLEAPLTEAEQDMVVPHDDPSMESEMRSAGEKIRSMPYAVRDENGNVTSNAVLQVENEKRQRFRSRVNPQQPPEPADEPLYWVLTLKQGELPAAAHKGLERAKFAGLRRSIGGSRWVIKHREGLRGNNGRIFERSGPFTRAQVRVLLTGDEWEVQGDA